LKGIEIEDLWVKYPLHNEQVINKNNDHILKGINLKISPGEFVVISGFTGVGKTTLISCLNGVAKNYYNAQINGNIYVNGKKINALKIGTISQKIGTILQDIEAQVFNLRVEDEIAFGCENLGIPPKEIKKRVQKYSKILQVDPKAEIEKLSLGQKQRVLTASVLAMEQDILLLDEPLANLDVNTAKVILEYLKDIVRDHNKIVVIIEHRIDLVLPYLTRLIWLKDGIIKDDLNREEAYNKYYHFFEGKLSHKKNDSTDCVFLLKGCDLGYKNNLVLQDVNLEIYKNDKIVVLGDNGSGKTTLLKSLCGLIKEKKGEIWRHPELRKNRFQKIAYVYQNPSYQLFMDSIYKEFEFQSKRNVIDKYLNLFGISNLRNRHPFTLSEGEKRLATIAIMASMEPKVLLLDEPTIGQDSKNLNKLLKSLEKINHKKGTIIINVTHDVRCAQSLGSRVIWLKNGTIYKEGNDSLVKEYFKGYSNIGN
jgi:energy-coupling factor transport system ATP-binding protein